MTEKIVDILGSVRFWQVVLGALAVYAESCGWLGEAERNLIVTILGSSVVLGTGDSIAKKLAGT